MDDLIPDNTVTIPKYMDEKVGLLSVRNADGTMIHLSWKTKEGRIIVFESNLEDYPASALLVFSDLEEYMDKIRNVSWINCREYIVNHGDELTIYGFPF